MLVFLTGNAGGAVNEDEDHAAEGPRNAENADAAALVGGALALVANHGQDSDVEKQKGGYEFSNDGPVKGPLA